MPISRSIKTYKFAAERKGLLDRAQFLGRYRRYLEAKSRGATLSEHICLQDGTSRKSPPQERQAINSSPFDCHQSSHTYTEQEQSAARIRNNVRRNTGTNSKYLTGIRNESEIAPGYGETRDGWEGLSRNGCQRSRPACSALPEKKGKRPAASEPLLMDARPRSSGEVSA